ncbi:unnamed protein product [Vitrella brassicaformis CCMP3155]|uniref:Uncharacterized protein n=3 Tax=Vitrella brassicaformis TaxID=1169539 RepID=A0A0G4ES29_VITBC|nr:unnamed protein product [Vitrella brassicaformis CCMP3155]|eukprot:CEM00854.1 unnamed protein product [Vitrella brassicaformis CCMP3155]
MTFRPFQPSDGLLQSMRTRIDPLTNIHELGGDAFDDFIAHHHRAHLQALSVGGDYPAKAALPAPPRASDKVKRFAVTRTDSSAPTPFQVKPAPPKQQKTLPLQDRGRQLMDDHLEGGPSPVQTSTPAEGPAEPPSLSGVEPRMSAAKASMAACETHEEDSAVAGARQKDEPLLPPSPPHIGSQSGLETDSTFITAPRKQEEEMPYESQRQELAAADGRLQEIDDGRTADITPAVADSRATEASPMMRAAASVGDSAVSLPPVAAAAPEAFSQLVPEDVEDVDGDKMMTAAAVHTGGADIEEDDVGDIPLEARRRMGGFQAAIHRSTLHQRRPSNRPNVKTSSSRFDLTAPHMDGQDSHHETQSINDEKKSDQPPRPPVVLPALRRGGAPLSRDATAAGSLPAASQKQPEKKTRAPRMATSAAAGHTAAATRSEARATADSRRVRSSVDLRAARGTTKGAPNASSVPDGLPPIPHPPSTQPPHRTRGERGRKARPPPKDRGTGAVLSSLLSRGSGRERGAIGRRGVVSRPAAPPFPYGMPLPGGMGHLAGETPSDLLAMDSEPSLIGNDLEVVKRRLACKMEIVDLYWECRNELSRWAFKHNKEMQESMRCFGSRAMPLQISAAASRRIAHMGSVKKRSEEKSTLQVRLDAIDQLVQSSSPGVPRGASAPFLSIADRSQRLNALTADS